MLKPIVEWTVERLRKGAEFEVEGAMVKGAAEGVPHACATVLGLTIMQARWTTGAVVGVAIVVWVLVRWRKGRRTATDSLPKIYDPFESEV